MARSSDALSGVARSLREGSIVAFPTDTVYGLGAVASHDAAVRKLFQVKQRDISKPIPFLLGEREQVLEVADALPRAVPLLMQRFWPGPLTLVLAKNPSFKSLAAGEERTVAVRVPDHPLVQELIRLIGEPLAVTSANVSGQPEALTAEEVQEHLGKAVDIIIDGGRCPGTPSTIVDLTQDPPRLLREGKIARGEIEKVGGIRLAQWGML